MSKTRKWYAKGLYIVFALALVVGLTFVPAMPVSATYVTQPTVTVSPNTEKLIGAHTINFSTSATGTLAVGEGIWVDFTNYNDAHSGDVPATYSTGDVTVNGAQVTAGNVKQVASMASETPTAADNTVVWIKTPVDIAAGASVEVIFKLSADITNPEAKGDQTLDVETEADTDQKTSTAYVIAGYTGKPVNLYNKAGVFVNSYNDITSAIAVAGATGWTIKVASDYNSAVSETVPVDVTAAKLTIESIDGAASTTIRDYDAAVTPCIIRISAANVTIDGFTIKGDGAYGAQDGIYCSYSGFTFKNNKFIDIRDDNIFVQSVTARAITSGTIDNNTLIGEGASATSTRGGIWLESYNSKAISGVAITNNTLSNFGTTLATSPDSTAINVAAQAGTVSDITITGNTVTDSYCGLNLWKGVTGMTGIANAIADNTFSGNRIGVYLIGATETNKFTLVNNTITDNTLYGIYLSGTKIDTGAAYNIRYNDLSGNTKWGIYNTYATVTAGTVVATHNWWGDASGPSGGTGTYASIATGSGDAVSKDVTYDPWLGASVSAADYATSISSLNAQATAGVKVTSSQSTEIGVAKYTGNPQTTPEFSAIGYFDVYLKIPTWVSGDLVNIKLYDAAVTSSSKAYFWDAVADEWTECYEDGAVAGDYVWVNVRLYSLTYPERVPVLGDLIGLPFAIGTPRALESIAATPASVSLDVGETQALTVTATYNDATTADVTATSTYSSDAPTVATVTAAGVITGVAAGSATITVSYTEGDVTAEDTVSVTVAGIAGQLEDAGIADETEMVYYFDNETKAWSYYAPGVPTSDLETLGTGSPYWIYVSANCTFDSTALYAGWNLIVW